MARSLFRRGPSYRRGQPLGLNMPFSGWLTLALAGGLAVFWLIRWVLS
ncbi:hypothetical protein [Maricaulis maris]|uniref:Uncharacterized protein n=1 Tax=Maricaulis maris TaxID=74318 RepID=A0A495D3T7_9PROT|nr:hypothetical protein [Maricaulis maris]RKQ95449.1 hypothetical protein C7435_2551 [Maricaulis maris]